MTLVRRARPVSRILGILFVVIGLAGMAGRCSAEAPLLTPGVLPTTDAALHVNMEEFLGELGEGPEGPLVPRLVRHARRRLRRRVPHLPDQS